jgi:hypothetical protein
MLYFSKFMNLRHMGEEEIKTCPDTTATEHMGEEEEGVWTWIWMSKKKRNLQQHESGLKEANGYLRAKMSLPQPSDDVSRQKTIKQTPRH